MPDIIGALVGVGFLILWIYCIYDVITTGDELIQHLPKLVWLLIVVILPDLGSLLWLAFGRPRIWHRRAQDPTRRASYGAHEPGYSSGSQSPSPAKNPIVQYREDQALLRLREEQLNRREQELERRERGEI
jgi:Phospholipase_D-nuclease N-terminal